MSSQNIYRHQHKFHDPIADWYSRPQLGRGGEGMQIFKGSRRQLGGGIFATIKRYAIPLLKRIGMKALEAAPSAAAKGAEALVGMAKEAIEDARSGRKRIAEAIKDQVVEKVRRTADDFLLAHGGGHGRAINKRKNKKKKKGQLLHQANLIKAIKKKSIGKQHKDIFSK